jgi:hypothetical protein
MTDAQALKRSICEAAVVNAGRPVDELATRWVMSPGSFSEVRMAFELPPPDRVEDPWYLLGMPVDVRDDGGEPHLENPGHG